MIPDAVPEQDVAILNPVLEPEVSEPEDTCQMDFAIRMLIRHRTEKQLPTVSPRRLHYFIVSAIQPEEWVLPSSQGKTTVYENTLYWSNRLSSLLVEARILGLVPWDWISDEKNEPLIPMQDRQSVSTYWDITPAFISNLPELDAIDVLPDWNEWLNGIDIDYTVTHPMFNNQDFRVVVAIEKATSRNDLEKLCGIYGADLLIFGGQPSLTRINDVVERARNEDKPIMLLYISDLDVSGWDMAPAFFNRVEEMYPREDHQMVRVALTREQAIKYNLPESFDPDTKGKNTLASQTRITNFIRNTGGRSCIELDAIDESILLGLLRTELQKYSGSDKEDDDYIAATESARHDKEMIDPWNTELRMCGEVQEEYDHLKTEFNQIATEISALSEQYSDRIANLNYRKETIELSVVNAIRGAYGLEAPPEWSGLK
jgi:hypothetical protein